MDNRTPEQWIEFFQLNPLNTENIRRVQEYAVAAFKNQHYNPVNVARAQKIREGLRVDKK